MSGVQKGLEFLHLSFTSSPVTSLLHGRGPSQPADSPSVNTHPTAVCRTPSFTRTAVLIRPSFPWLVHILCQMNPVYNLLSYSFKKNPFNIIVSNTPGSSKLFQFFNFLHQNSAGIFPLPLMCHMPRPCRHPLFDHPNDIWWGILLMF